MDNEEFDELTQQLLSLAMNEFKGCTFEDKTDYRQNKDGTYSPRKYVLTIQVSEDTDVEHPGGGGGIHAYLQGSGRNNLL